MIQKVHHLVKESAAVGHQICLGCALAVLKDQMQPRLAKVGGQVVGEIDPQAFVRFPWGDLPAKCVEELVGERLQAVVARGQSHGHVVGWGCWDSWGHTDSALLWKTTHGQGC